MSGRAPWRAFELDTPEGRRILGLPADSRCADGVFVHPGPESWQVVVVELKGRADLKHAIRQIESVLEKLLPELDGCARPVAVSAAVVGTSSSPRDKKRHMAAFQRRWQRWQIALKLRSGVGGKRALPIREVL